MTFDDDFLRLTFDNEVHNLQLKGLGLSWPPPEKISLGGVVFVRQSYSAISDEQRQLMSHVCRGAQYIKSEDCLDSSSKLN